MGNQQPSERQDPPAPQERRAGTVTDVARQIRAAKSERAPTATVDILAGMAIARLPLIVIDCPDPGALARFYGAMLDWQVDVSATRASACAEHGQCISFHKVDGYTPPMWPTAFCLCLN